MVGEPKEGEVESERKSLRGTGKRGDEAGLNRGGLYDLV